MWQLVINGPGYFDTKYDLPEGTTHVGRADENDVVLSGDHVSRKHARFHVTGNALVFEDLGSRNGTRLNGDKVVGTSPMKPGDVVAVGENSLVVRQPTTAETAATEMVDAGGGGVVRRFGRGVDVSHAVLMARDIQDSIVRRVLDNSISFEVEDHEPPPVPNNDPNPEEPVYITIQETGSIFIASQQSSIETLPVDVCAALGGGECREERVFVRADAEVKYNQFMEVMNRLQENGFLKVGLLNEDIE